MFYAKKSIPLFFSFFFLFHNKGNKPRDTVVVVMEESDNHKPACEDKVRQHVVRHHTSPPPGEASRGKARNPDAHRQHAVAHHGLTPKPAKERRSAVRKKNHTTKK